MSQEGDGAKEDLGEGEAGEGETGSETGEDV